jgi:hypothetical protein
MGLIFIEMDLTVFEILILLNIETEKNELC